MTEPTPTLNVPSGARYARLLSVGAYRPERVVHNDELVEAINSSDQWIRERSGIVSRRWAAPDESVTDMAEKAAPGRPGPGRALGAADVDAVLVATVTHPYQTPSAAAMLTHRLGATPAAAFDLSAACAGFCYGVSLANDMVRGGSARHVLVVGVEKLSDFTDLTDRSTAFIFGDGAGAVVIGPERRARDRADDLGFGRVAVGGDRQQVVVGRVPRGREPRVAGTEDGGADGVPVGGVADGARGPEGAGRRRHRGRRARRLHPAPGERAHRVGDGQAAAAARAPSRSPTTSSSRATPRRRPCLSRWTACSRRGPPRTAGWRCSSGSARG